MRRNGELRLNPEFPHDGSCASGHFPAPPLSTKFFNVVARPGTTPHEVLTPGVYCEWCLAVANRLKQCKKKGLDPDFDTGEYLEQLLEEAWLREDDHYG